MVPKKGEITMGNQREDERMAFKRMNKRDKYATWEPRP